MPLNKFGSTSHAGENKFKRKRFEHHSFPLTAEGNYDFGNRKLCNVEIPTEKKDVVIKDFLDLELAKVTSSLKAIEEKIMQNHFESDSLNSELKNKFVSLKYNLEKDFEKFVETYRKTMTVSMDMKLNLIRNELRTLKKNRISTPYSSTDNEASSL